MTIQRFAVGRCAYCHKVVAMSIMDKKEDRIEAYKDLAEWEQKGLEAEIMIREEDGRKVEWCGCGRGK